MPKQPGETYNLVIKLLEEHSPREVAEITGINIYRVYSFMKTKRNREKKPERKPVDIARKDLGYVPALYPGMEYWEMLNPDAVKEFISRRG